MGILYIVPTPVGNMEDMTLRAIRILKEADLVLAEDTRTSGILFKHFDIHNHLMSHHKFNEHGTTAGIVERLKAGQTIALISDAGTPGISDPGFFLAREAAKGMHTGNCLFRVALRPLLLRRVPSSEKGASDAFGGSKRRNTDDGLLRVSLPTLKNSQAVRRYLWGRQASLRLPGDL